MVLQVIVGMEPKGYQIMFMIDKDEILHQLNAEAESYDFPMLDNGYYYHADQKMTIFRDEKRWAILIETLAYNNHQQDIEGITTVAAVFGNCLTGWNDNSNFHYFAADNRVEAFEFDEENEVVVLNEQADSIKVRNEVIPIQFDIEHYLAKGIKPENGDKIAPWEFLRGLVPAYSHLFWVTREEIANKIPLDLPVFMTLDSWHHPDLAAGELPGDKETFQQLADALVTGNKALYNTVEAVNTHWKNWPEGGTL